MNSILHTPPEELVFSAFTGRSGKKIMLRTKKWSLEWITNLLSRSRRWESRHQIPAVVLQPLQAVFVAVRIANVCKL